MLIYFFVYFLVLCTATQNSRRIKQSIQFILVLFLCFGYMTGSDWRVYELNYYTIKSFSDIVHLGLSTHEEIGYNLLVWLSNSLGIGFWPFHIFFKCAVMIILFKTAESFNVSVSQYFVIYFATACFMFVDCPFRNMIAWGISMFSLRYIGNKQFLRYLFCVIIAASIHLSAVIMLVLYPVYHFKKEMNIIVVALIIVGLYIFAFAGTGLIEMVNSLTAASEYADRRLAGYASSDVFAYSPINSNTIFSLIIFVFAIFNRKEIKKQKYGHEVFNLFCLYEVLLPIANSFRMFGRFTIYLSLFSIVIIIYLIRSINEKTMKLAFVSFVVLFSIARIQFVLSQDCRYVPYSNYLQYVFNPPTYGFRDNYNPHHSQYRDFR